MKTLKKRITSIVMLVLVLATAILPVTGSAAVSFPSISSSKPVKAYTISTGNNTTVYSDTSLKTKYGTIYATDECQILSITKNSAGTYIVKVKYAVSSGYKTGYCKLSVFTSASAPTAKYTASAKITTYRRASTSATAGYIASGDTVYQLATSGNFTQVMYPSGSSAWRLAWVTTANFNKYVKGTSTSSTVTMSSVLYGLSGSTKSYVTCGFDGYTTTSGRHEGIDFAYSSGSNVYSLTSGVVTRVTEGKAGSTSSGGALSTIAIYNSSTGKTVIYLHTNPVDSLYVGQSISVGQKIGTESNCGASNAHTHVEVRDGKKTAAAVSVGDSVLDNANPTSFWNGLGYTVK